MSLNKLAEEDKADVRKQDINTETEKEGLVEEEGRRKRFEPARTARLH